MKLISEIINRDNCYMKPALPHFLQKMNLVPFENELLIYFCKISMFFINISGEETGLIPPMANLMNKLLVKVGKGLLGEKRVRRGCLELVIEIEMASARCDVSWSPGGPGGTGGTGGLGGPGDRSAMCLSLVESARLATAATCCSARSASQHSGQIPPRLAVRSSQPRGQCIFQPRQLLIHLHVCPSVHLSSACQRIMNGRAMVNTVNYTRHDEIIDNESVSNEKIIKKKKNTPDDPGRDKK